MVSSPGRLVLLTAGTATMMLLLLKLPTAVDARAAPDAKLGGGEVDPDVTILDIRHLPEIKGFRSNVYEVYMQPYAFPPAPLTGVARMRGADPDDDGPLGEVVFTQPEPPVGPVIVRGNITGVSPGLHGLHVRVWGDLEDGCEAAGPHYNPHAVRHGGPLDPHRHVGDLGNVRAGEDGVAVVDLVAGALTLAGPRSVAGRALVLTAGQDDLGLSGSRESFETGASGPGLACGVIVHSRAIPCPPEACPPGAAGPS